jgi:hypothetical protein
VALARRRQDATLVGGFIIAGFAAGIAVHETVVANADVERGLAKAAIFVALALRFGHFALSATVFGLAGSGGHSNNANAEGRNGECAVGNLDT